MAQLLIRFLLVLAVLLLIYWLVFRRRAPRVAHKCVSCRHAVRVDQDGALCRMGSTTVFKNKVHIENCPHFERQPA